LSNTLLGVASATGATPTIWPRLLVSNAAVTAAPGRLIAVNRPLASCRNPEAVVAVGLAAGDLVKPQSAGWHRARAPRPPARQPILA
jgi:hypothetical protein